jgi:hypothetical protein
MRKQHKRDMAKINRDLQTRKEKSTKAQIKEVLKSASKLKISGTMQCWSRKILLENDIKSLYKAQNLDTPRALYNAQMGTAARRRRTPAAAAQRRRTRRRRRRRRRRRWRRRSGRRLLAKRRLGDGAGRGGQSNAKLLAAVETVEGLYGRLALMSV